MSVKTIAESRMVSLPCSKMRAAPLGAGMAVSLKRQTAGVRGRGAGAYLAQASMAQWAGSCRYL
jgi:hypothetical protein